MIDLSFMASTRSPRRRDFSSISGQAFCLSKINEFGIPFSIEFQQFSTRQRSKVVTAFDSNGHPYLQISNPFGGAGSSPANVGFLFFLLFVSLRVEWLRERSKQQKLNRSLLLKPTWSELETRRNHFGRHQRVKHRVRVWCLVPCSNFWSL